MWVLYEVQKLEKKIDEEIPRYPSFTFHFFQVPEHLTFTKWMSNKRNIWYLVLVYLVWVTQGRRGTWEELKPLGWNSDEVSMTGWQAHDGQGSACRCHAACLQKPCERSYSRTIGMTKKRWPRKKPGDQEVAVAIIFTTWVPLNIQTSAIEQRWPRATQILLEHSGGSGLGHENRLLWRVPRVCELFLSNVVVERYRRESRAVAVESFWKMHRVYTFDSAAYYFSFFFLFFFLVRTPSAVSHGCLFRFLFLFFFLLRTGPYWLMNHGYDYFACTAFINSSSSGRVGCTYVFMAI